jgi:type IV pilus assembly protein PilC
MPVFQYSGRDRKGDRIRGKMKALNQREATIKLKELGIAIRSMEELTGILYREINLIQSRIKHKDLMIYIRQFTTLIKAGISVVDATRILAEQTDQKVLKRVLYEMEEDIKSGMSYSESTEKFPSIFPPMYVNMMKAGEASGQLEEILERMAVYFEKQYSTRQKVKSALAYPTILACISFAVIIFMLTFIVPRFSDMFASFNAKLPAMTLFLLHSSEYAKKFGWVLLLLIVLIYFGIRYFSKTKKGGFYVDYLKLKIPLFGKVIQKAILARMTRTLSSLFAASVPVLQSISIVEKVVENKVMAKVLYESKVYLQEGKSIAEPMKNHWAIPPFVSHMILLGEQSGTLDYMLEKVAEFYESEVEQATDQMKSLLEPMMIIFLAVVVGTIVASIAIPMFSIFQDIK